MLNKNIQLKNFINNDYYNDVYFIFIKKLLNSFLKKGNRACALKLFYNLKYKLKMDTKIDSNFLLLIALVKSLTKFHFIKKKRVDL